MPNRYVRESAIESEAVNALSWRSEVFFRRLINKVDDFGLYTANPNLLRAACFPLQLEKVSAKDICQMLEECQSCGLLFVYDVEGKSYLAMNKWEKGRANTTNHKAPPEDIRKQMQTFVYTCKHTKANTPDSDSDSDSDSDNIPPALAGSDFDEAWSAWIQHRKQLRKKLTKLTKEKQLQTLAMMGKEKAIKSINLSIQNGWQGLFEPKADNAAEKPVSASVEAIQRSKELEEVNKLIAALRQDGHMELDDEDRRKLKELKTRQKELKAQLGWKI